MTRSNDPEAAAPKPTNAEALPIFERWSDFAVWLIPITDHFPKRTRFTLVGRIQDLALDVLDDLTIAAYTRDKLTVLDRANLRLTRLRVMLRIARELGHLPTARHEAALNTIDEVGRMLGGWRRSLRGRSR